jgi:hypothetical protein
MADERARLAQADRHVDEAKTRIDRQRELIKKLRQGGHDTELAASLLRALETSLGALKYHRDLILGRLDQR